jgi:uncharacterized hydrophobic protein (TIGR00271 family)
VLHLTLRVPGHLEDRVVTLLRRDETVTNLVLLPDAFVDPRGSLVEADVAREAADRVVGGLREIGLHHEGSVRLTETETILSDAVSRAEQAAPGLPEDSVVWDIIENQARIDSRLSFAFVSFLTLSTVIAGAGRLLDQPILIIGAMVVGPEFSQVAAICLGLARPRPSLIPKAALTLGIGFLIAVALATPAWWAAYQLGAFTQADARGGSLTDFIVKPDVWSFVIALLAGVAGALSLTTAKSGPLVGVFISVTTVPAVGTLALCLAAGIGSEVAGALLQLGINLLGLVLAGTATFLVQRLAWRHIGVPGKPGAARRRRL